MTLRREEKQRKHLEKKREKEEKREGERGELIFQALFEDLKHVLGCNIQSKSLYLLIW